MIGVPGAQSGVKLMAADRDRTLIKVAAPGLRDGTPESSVAASPYRARQAAVDERRNDFGAVLDEKPAHFRRVKVMARIFATDLNRGKSHLVDGSVGQRNLLSVEGPSTAGYGPARLGRPAWTRIFTKTSSEPVPTTLGVGGKRISIAGNSGNARDV